MAFSQSSSPNATYRDVHQQLSTQAVGSSISHSSPVQQHPRQASKQRFVADLSQCLFDFVIQLLPTQEEMAVKEDVRKLLERLIRTIEPESRLLSFGSTANGFSLRNSDMDLCCLIDSEDKLSAADLVTMLGDLLERETKFHVKTLPHARIPIVKLTLDPSPGLPHGIACDIGFENRLALENTRLLMCYAMIDPTRVRTMVLFLKVWSKRRKINSPYKGTLSSYGYVLLVIYFLVHVKNPPILPNLQQMPPLRPITKEETHLNGFNIWFFDDIDLLRQRWVSENTESVGELLIDFFRYYARDFQYNTGVASIRAGLLKKDAKGWQNDYSGGRYDPSRERNRLCIEDPFETDYNVARCVTKDGLYTIRGEFMRASRVLSARPDRAIVALAELCEERKDEELMSAPTFTPHRPPPQTPYTVGSNSMRPKGTGERLSPPSHFYKANPGAQVDIQAPEQITTAPPPPPPPEHMAPKRSKWTSPPPLEAGAADRTFFEHQLDKGLELATAPTEAREPEAVWGSETNSEVFTDEERSDAAESDDITSVKSYTEGSSTNPPGFTRRPSWHLPDGGRLPQFHQQPIPNATPPNPTLPRLSTASLRTRLARQSGLEHSLGSVRHVPEFVPTARADLSRRLPGSPNMHKTGNHVWTHHTPGSSTTPVPESPELPLDRQAESQSPHQQQLNEGSTVFYQTATTTRSPRPVIYPPGSHNSLLSHYQSQQSSPLLPHSTTSHSPSIQHQQYSPSLQQHQPHQVHPGYHQYGVQVPPDILPPALSSLNPRNGLGFGGRSGGPETPTPGSYAAQRMHSHSNSTTSTITAPTPPPAVQPAVISPVLPTNSSTGSRSSPLVEVRTPSLGNRSPQQQRNGNQGHPARSPRHSNPDRAHLARQNPPQTLQLNGNGILLDESRANVDSERATSGLSGARGMSTESTTNGTGSPNLSAANSTETSPSPSSTGYSSSVSRSPSPRSPSSRDMSPPMTAIPIKKVEGGVVGGVKVEGAGEVGVKVVGFGHSVSVKEKGEVVRLEGAEVIEVKVKEESQGRSEV